MALHSSGPLSATCEGAQTLRHSRSKGLVDNECFDFQEAASAATLPSFSWEPTDPTTGAIVGEAAGIPWGTCFITGSDLNAALFHANTSIRLAALELVCHCHSRGRMPTGQCLCSCWLFCVWTYIGFCGMTWSQPRSFA